MKGPVGAGGGPEDEDDGEKQERLSLGRGGHLPTLPRTCRFSPSKGCGQVLFAGYERGRDVSDRRE